MFLHTENTSANYPHRDTHPYITAEIPGQWGQGTKLCGPLQKQQMMLTVEPSLDPGLLNVSHLVEFKMIHSVCVCVCVCV